jgi:hypothetical protein
LEFTGGLVENVSGLLVNFLEEILAKQEIDLDNGEKFLEKVEDFEGGLDLELLLDPTFVVHQELLIENAVLVGERVGCKGRKLLFVF